MLTTSCRLYAALLLVLAIALPGFLSSGCAALSGHTRQTIETAPEMLRVDDLVSRAYRAAAVPGGSLSDAPPYIQALLADGRLTVALGIGTPDLGVVRVPDDTRQYHSISERTLFGQKVTIETHLVLTREAFRQALAECELVFVTSHSRFGAGPVFLADGKDKPFRMQRTKGYKIIMPRSEVSGYTGNVVRSFYDPLKKKHYVVFAPDSTELDSAVPYPGCQVIVLSTCTSKKHFLDEIRDFRQGYPTAAIFTARAGCMDPDMTVFMRCLYEIFQGRSIYGVAEGMNEQYRTVAWSHIRRKKPPWKIIDRMYTVGINTVR